MSYSGYSYGEPPRGAEQSGDPWWKRVWIWAAAALALSLWFFRPWLHWFYIELWKYPLVWFAPLIAGLLVGAITVGIAYWKRRSQERSGDEDESDRAYALSEWAEARVRRRWLRAPLWITGAVVVLVWAAASILAPMLTARATYERYSFEQISELPEAGQVRVLPKQVAETMAANGYSSPTERLKEPHIIRTPEGSLAWSFQQAPGGFWRTIFSKTQGSATLDASSTSRRFAEQAGEFETAPNQAFFDNVTWMAYKEHPLTTVAETTMILSADGEPLLLAPYISYEGFPVKVPVLGGVYVIHPNGEVEDLSPEEAEARSEITESGRLFPESLARTVISSYQYKNGIINKLFQHTDQIELADDGAGNQQPYLMDFGGDQGTEWVATAKPHGRSYATAGVFLTDTVTGETKLWQPEESSSLTGNQKAIETVQGLAIPGIDFTDYNAVEPRPVFIGGELHFLISIVPNSNNTVTKSVVVNAANNKVTAIFDHDTDSQADEELIRYIDTGELPSSAAYDESEGSAPERGDGAGAGAAEGDGGDLGELSDAELKDLLRQLRENQLEQDALIDELERRLSE